MRRNMQRDCGTDTKPRLSDGTLSVWTRRLGVPWTEIVVTKRAVQKWWKSARHELTLCNHEFLPYRVILRVRVLSTSVVQVSWPTSPS